jgi:ubiquinol-cytochrome c reductase iron-sulfur subunit
VADHQTTTTKTHSTTGADAGHASADAGHGHSRRDVLQIMAGGWALVGAGALAWPLIDQMNPDANALALGSTEVDLAPIAEGQAITAVWRGKPVFIRHRTAKEIEEARAVKVDDLPDRMAQVTGAKGDLDASDVNRVKDGKEKWLVMVGICTHLGCIPTGTAVGEPKGEFGGWFCPCHGSVYDTSGRIRKGPAPRNLEIPPYAFQGDTKIKIG